MLAGAKNKIKVAMSSVMAVFIFGFVKYIRGCEFTNLVA